MKGRYNYLPPSDPCYRVKDNLDMFINRIKKGMVLRGRIIDRLGEDRYLLRVWGYNILTESQSAFAPFDEIKLVVKETNPVIVFDLCSERSPKRQSLGISSQGLSLLVY